MTVRQGTRYDCKASYTAIVFCETRQYWCQLPYRHMGPHNDGALNTGFVRVWNDPQSARKASERKEP